MCGLSCQSRAWSSSCKYSLAIVLISSSAFAPMTVAAETAHGACVDEYFDLLVTLSRGSPDILLQQTRDRLHKQPSAENRLRLGIVYLRTERMQHAQAQFEQVDGASLCPAARELLALYRADIARWQLQHALEIAEAKLDALTSIEQRAEDNRSREIQETLDE